MNNSLLALLRLALQVMGRRYQEPVIRLARVECAIEYIKAVRLARKLAVAGLAGLVLTSLTAGSFLLMHVAVVIYLPVASEVKGLMLLGCGLIYFVICVSVLAYVMREGFWLRITRADQAATKALANT